MEKMEFNIHVRDLLKYTTEELSNSLTGRITLTFDNGEKIQTNVAETIFTSYVWDLFRTYPEATIRPNNHIHHHISKKKFGSNTTVNLYTAAFRSIIEAYDHKEDFDVDEVVHLIYKVNNNLYNNIKDIIASWRVSLDILDFRRVEFHDAIVKIKEEMEISPNGIEQAQKDIISVLKNDKNLDDSVLAQGVRSGIMSPGQVFKCIGVIGYVTDVDSRIFPKPVITNYTKGIRLIYDSLIESRSGAKSLQFSKAPLQETEYFARRLRLMCMNISRVVKGDCGSKEYIHWYVRPDVLDENGRLIQEGDLGNLLGKYYLDPETGKEKVITEDCKHLIGQEIKIRSVHNCRWPKSGEVCSRCFGMMYYSIPKHANLGHYCSVTMISPISQKVLSVKHLDGSAVVESATVAEADKILMKVADSGNGYKLVASSLKLKPKLIIPAKEAKMLSMIYNVDSVYELNIERITELSSIQFSFYTKPVNGVEDKDVIPIEIRSVPVSQRRRMGSLTHEFLEYVREVGWTYDDKKDYVVDLSGWDFNKLFIKLPLKHHSMADHANDIAKHIEYSSAEKENERKGKKQGKRTFAAALAQLFDMVNSKASVNIAILEIVMMSATIISEEEHNYAIPKGFTTYEFGVAGMNMRYRSIAAAMMFQGHSETLSDPINYLVSDRPDHPYDALVTPNEIVQYRKRVDRG